jgi:GAF domain-containing protein
MSAHEIASKDTVLRQLLDEAVDAVRAAEGSILLLSDDGKCLRFAVSHSPVADKLRGLEQPLGKGVTGLSVSLQQPMIVNETQRSTAFDPSVDAKTGVNTKSIMVIPLVTPEREFGALTAINSAANIGFVAHDLERYSDFAEQIASRLSHLGLGIKDVGAVK